jgi:hypothetical protein
MVQSGALAYSYALRRGGANRREAVIFDRVPFYFGMSAPPLSTAASNIRKLERGGADAAWRHAEFFFEAGRERALIGKAVAAGNLRN